MPAQLQDAEVGQPYSVTFTTSMGNGFTWSIAPGTGTLPTGLILDSGGFLSGTPTSSGTYNFTVQARDIMGFGPTQGYTLFVLPALTFVTTSPLPPSIVNQPYRAFSFMTNGGKPPYTYAIPQTPFNPTQSLPDGLTLSSTGHVSGTPTTAGTTTFNITVTDADGYSLTQNFTLTIVNQLFITTPTPLPDGAINVAYSVTIEAMGGQGPYTFSLPKSENPPPGLAL